MLPKLEFNILLWAFLPGVPFSLTLYLVIIRYSEIISVNTEHIALISSAYFLVTPLIIGLFIDGIRHLLTPLHFFPMWDHFSSDQAKIDKGGNLENQYCDEFFSKICVIYSLNFNMYEFFGNFFLSVFFSIVLLLFFISSPFNCEIWHILLPVFILVLSSICMSTFAKMNIKNLNKWFPKKSITNASS